MKMWVRVSLTVVHVSTCLFDYCTYACMQTYVAKGGDWQDCQAYWQTNCGTLHMQTSAATHVTDGHD